MAESQPAVPSLLGGYARGVAWTYAGVVLTGAATFFLAGWTVRRVGTAEFGQFAVVASVAGLLTMFDYALGLATQRAGARADHGAVHAAHGAYVRVGAVLAVVAIAAAAVVEWAGPGRMPRLGATVALLGLATALQIGSAALPAVAVGTRRFSSRSAATITGLAVRVVVAVLLVGRLGVPGLALAQLLGVAVDRLVLVALLRRAVPWFVARPSSPDQAALRDVAGYAVPLLVLNVSAQILVVSDLVVIGALVGASAVGVYQVGTLLPVQVAGFLMIGYNVAFPALAGTDDPAGQEAAGAFLTGLFCFVGATGLALAAFLRADVVEVLLGHASGLGRDVVAVTAGIGLANLMLHGLVSVLIARGEQQVMARLVAIELPVNLVLTVVLVVWFGPVGAALATLATVALMNFVAFPLVCRDRFARSVADFVVRHGLFPAVLGTGVALGAAQVARLAGASAGRLVFGGLLAGAVGGPVGLALLGRDGRRTLRETLASGRPPTPDPAPAVAP